MIRLGIHSERNGKKVTNTKTTMEASMNGHIALTMRSTEILAITEATNKHIPKGGVVSPIIKFKTMIIPYYGNHKVKRLASFSPYAQ